MFNEEQRKQITSIDKCNSLSQSNDLELLDFCVKEIVNISGEIIPNIKSKLKGAGQS